MRLIDADALMEKVCENCHENYCIPDATDTVYGCELAESINQMPTVEPERKKGHINICNGFECCSECGKCLGIGYTNYCGYCGAELEVT